MKTLRSRMRGVGVIVFVMVPVLVSLACSLALGEAGAPTPMISAVTPGPVGVATAAATEPEGLPTAFAEELFGLGPFNLADLTVGLADLDGYAATLTMSFEGSQAGAAVQWSKTIVMLAAREPAARLLTIERQGDLPDTSPVLLAEMGGVGYEVTAEHGCLASSVGPEGGSARELEPARMLTGVLGAAEAGQETVNETSSNHYTFDERALGQLGLAKSNGELWVAAEGGHVVRYVMSTTGDADTFGVGTAGTLTMDYELTVAPQTLSLPADCPAGLVDVPQLPDAANLESTPGILAYTTEASLVEAAAFYLGELPALGWALAGDPAAVATPAPDQTGAVLDFIRGDERLTVILRVGEVGTLVRVVASRGA